MKKIIKILIVALFASTLLVHSVSAYTEMDIYSNDGIYNGDFEKVSLDGWTYNNMCLGNLKYDSDTYTYYLRLGTAYDAYQSMYQNALIPSDVGKARLSFDYQFFSIDTNADDYFLLTVLDRETSQVYLMDAIYPTEGDFNDKWYHKSYDLTQYKDKSVSVIFAVNNDNNYYTYTNLDNIHLRFKSYSEINGTVKNNGKKFKNATVKIKTKKGKILWQGKTNKKGKFTATGLKGLPNKAKISVSKNKTKKTFRKNLKWGKSYNYTFKLW